jgi:hypothetical protein
MMAIVGVDERMVVACSRRTVDEHVEWTYATVVSAFTPAASALSIIATVLSIILSFLISSFCK